MIRFNNALIAMFFMISCMNLSSQNYDYRYYESPAVSWNGMTMYDSRQLSMGGLSLASSEHAMQISNPALITEKKGVEIGFSYNFILYQSFQYWGINEGVRRYREPFSENKTFPGSLSARFGFGKSNLTVGWYRSALNDFPDFSFLSEYDSEQHYEFNGKFSGFDESYFISMGIPLSSKFNVGLKFEYRRGIRNAEIENSSSLYYFLDNSWQLKEERSEYSENNISELFIPGLGFSIDINKKLKAGLIIKYPLRGKVNRKIIRSFSNNEGLNINDKYIYKDDHFDVPGIAVGMLYTMEKIKIFRSTGQLILGAEIEYRKWSDYKYIFFGEEYPRDTIDTIKFSAGAEYGKKVKNIEMFFRFGMGLDKQPLRDPGTVLKKISSGFGVKGHGVNAGIGVSYLHGSSGGKGQGHLIICTSISKIL